jgi:peptide/nickel transport system permease protein
MSEPAAELPLAARPAPARMPLSAAIGFAIVGVALLLAVFGAMLAPYPEAKPIGDVFEPPGARAWLGTDYLGRDMLSRLLYGAQTTLGIAFAATLLAFFIGVSAGLLAATAGGWIDAVMSRLVDALLAIPSLVMALVILSAVGRSNLVLILTMATIAATRPFRLSRATALDILAKDFVEAARARGERFAWIMYREVVPNIVGPLVTDFGLRFTFAILFLSSLSFLGLGVQPPAADWGFMVRENAQALLFGLPTPLIPAAAIGIVSVGVNLLVDWQLARRNRDMASEAA